MALTAEQVDVSLGGRRMLHAIDMSFEPGRVTALLGPNGAGKTSLLRAMAGLIVPSAGRIALDGGEVARMPARERAKAIGYLPQDAVVHWNMTVRDLVALGRLPHGGGGAEAIEAALVATDTAALAGRPVRSLSGGERARVLLARVLAGEPRWLLADEPLASLDPLHQVETLALLRAAAARGIGVVIVLHDLTLAARGANDVVLLKEGRVLAAGPGAAVLTPANLAATYGIAIAVIDHPGGRAIVPASPA